jgi:pimeloyl-ACP methyl ester carboxylesterase
MDNPVVHSASGVHAKEPAMTTTLDPPATIAGAHHHTADVNGTRLHYVTLGDQGAPVLLVHGFPESWWAFRRLMPILASSGHRVVAVDLRGFGDSAVAPPGFDAAMAAADLAALIEHLGLGPVHLVGQDISGQVVYRAAASHPTLVRSLVAVETGLPGFGAEALADVQHGGAWYIGALATDTIPDLLFRGREQAFISEHLYPSYGVTDPVVTLTDGAEFVRGYARDGGLSGASGLYRSLLHDGEDIRRLARDHLGVPVLAVGSFGGPFTEGSMRHVADDVTSVQIDGAGHYLAQEDPQRLADAIATFVADQAGDRSRAPRNDPVGPDR